MSLLFFEFLGTTELMVILVAALVLFGPRKLPEISRQIGKGLAEFRKASDDFRQTWEKEVQREVTTKDAEMDHATPLDGSRITENTIDREHVLADHSNADPAALPESSAAISADETGVMIPSHHETVPEPTRKRDWL